MTAETGAALTYDELGQVVASLAGRLATLGVGQGSRVALVIPGGPDFLQLLLAVASLGATAAPLNPAYKRDEYEFYLDDLKPELLLVPAGDLPAAREAVGDTVEIVDVARAGQSLTLATAGGTVERESPFEGAGPDDVALLLHTSGTTSRPKQVPLLQRNLIGLGADDRRLLPARPGGHLVLRDAALPRPRPRRLDVRGACGRWHGGRAAAVRAARVLAPAAEHGVTWFSAGPTLHQMILDRIDAEGAPARCASRGRAARR